MKKSKVERQPSGARPADLVPLPVVRLGIDQDGRPTIDVDWLIDFLTTYVRPRALSPISVRAAAPLLADELFITALDLHLLHPDAGVPFETCVRPRCARNVAALRAAGRDAAARPVERRPQKQPSKERK